ncbi:hypothetical protein OHR68_25905 [Spirillospora sp. NBC_00431]
MIDWSAVEIDDEHIAALRSLLQGDPGASEKYASGTDDAAASGYTMVIYSAFAVAVRRRFSPKYTHAQLARYVADLRISLGADASQINPRVAESMMRAALGDETLKDHEPYGADLSTMVVAELAILDDLAQGAELDDLLNEAADHAHRWLAAERAKQAAGVAADG